MDDFVISNLNESRNEWCSRLVSVLSPMVMEGIKSIYNEAWNMCVSSNEKSKYLMTFQNLLSRIPKWNSTLIEEERKRIIEKSGCTYLEDLITCVHVIQLKILTCIRVGNKQKKIDISVPKLDHFLHRVYIMVARKCYSNVYLFERGVSDLNLQRNNREFEVMVQECILCAIRESIPTESIIRAYMDEAVEDEEEVIIEPIKEEEDEPTTVKESEKKEGEETDEELKEKNYANFLGKMGTYPKVQFEKKDIKDKFVVQEKTYASVYDDKQLLKMAKSDMEEEKGVSILLPINFTFTVHGVSGIKRGDRFRVTGIPNKYKDGFFQVLGVKHTIQGMEWTTEVEGGFRNNT